MLLLVYLKFLFIYYSYIIIFSTSKPSLIVGHASAVADHSISSGHNIKWDHFEILASGQCDLQCKIKETLLIRDLKPALNENVGTYNIYS